MKSAKVDTPQTMPLIGKHFVRKLISEVRRRPHLYATEDADYHNLEARDKAWEDIGTELKRDAYYCKKRWKALRENFGRQCKNGKISDSAIENNHNWAYYEELGFLKKYIRTRRSFKTGRCSSVEVYFGKGEKKSSSVHADEESINEQGLIINLIEAVQEEECLYKVSHKHYGNDMACERAWQNVARNCNLDKFECKIRWGLLREKYNKEIYKLQRNSTDNEKSKWQYFDYLSFLQSSVMPEVDMAQTNLPPINSPYPSDPNFSRQQASEMAEEPSKTDELFMSTMLELMGDLPIHLRDQFQARMFQEIYKLRSTYRNCVK